jgi:4-aminobutyrate aminotransferase
VAMSGGYHGRTYGAMSLTTSKTIYRQTFGPLPAGVAVASYPYCLQCPTRKAAGGLDFSVAPCVSGVGGRYESRQCCGTPIQDLHHLLKTQSHPSETAAIIIEPILGEGGFLVPPPGFLEELRRVCDLHGMLLIFDEVQSGVGRTGHWWAHQGLTAVQPDIMIFAKGIASGFPFAGLATREDAYDKMTPGQMGGTYGGSALGCAAAVGTLEAIIQDDMVSNSQLRGVQMIKGLVDLSKKYPIAEVRGRGLMVAVEFDGPPNTASAVVEAGYDEGLLLITAGINQTVRLLPPLCITEDEVAFALEKLDVVFGRVFV